MKKIAKQTLERMNESGQRIIHNNVSIEVLENNTTLV